MYKYTNRIEKIIEQIGIKFEDLPVVEKSPEAWDKLHQIVSTANYDEQQYNSLKEFTAEEMQCIKDFKNLQKHMWLAEHKRYDWKMREQFTENHKRMIGILYKNSNAKIDMLNEINSIVSIHHDI